MGDAVTPRNVVKLVRDLQRRKARERRELVLLEGRRLVADALNGGARVVAVLASDHVEHAPDVGPLVAKARQSGASVEVVARKDFEALADTDSPSGVLAVAEWEPVALDRLPAPGARAVALVLDGVQDPGNVGTMIRTAHALGAWCTIALDGTADVRGPKVLRGAMGSHFRHPIAEASFDELAAFVERREISVLLAASDGTAIPLAAPRFPLAVVVGSEGHGVRAAWNATTARRIAIAMTGDAESLNAAVAAGILLHELTRVA